MARARVFMNIHWLCMLDNYWEVTDEHTRYIVELSGKLLMVGSNHNWWSRCLRNARGPRALHRTELVDTDIARYEQLQHHQVEVGGGEKLRRSRAVLGTDMLQGCARAG
jgi:predicted phosphohydrolase